MNSRALSLLEVVFALAIVTILVGVLSFANLTTLKGWYQIGHRNDLRENLQGCFDKLENVLKRGKSVVVNSQSIRFGVNESGADNYYIYYLYNSSDIWPPNYNQTSYDLRLTPLSGGINGSFTYGAGELVCAGLNSPGSPSCNSQNTCMNIGSKSVTVNLAQTRNAELISLKNSIRLRNA